MHLHILGICGTFMGGIALLARQLGHRVSGSDANVYPPMSTLLADHGIDVQEGYSPDHLHPAPDVVVIGNAMSRGNPAVEAVLDRGLAYTSGPQWLAEHVLAGRWVLGVAGTHGKTTTASMLAWILQHAGLEPGFLIGGVPRNFGVSARLGETPFFVVEADEYDTAFFDKRSKFVHYRPRTLVLNNLEFDHADIFADLAAIQRQVHHLVRTIPGGNGLIISAAGDKNLDQTLDMGCWTPVERFDGDGAAWSADTLDAAGEHFRVLLNGESQGEAEWGLMGQHNIHNALAAIAAARHAGVPVKVAIEALKGFKNVARRMELRAQLKGISVYDDFAHHPTAIATTLQGLRARMAGEGRILAVLEPRSNTMRMGVHQDSLRASLGGADRVFLYRPADLGWDLDGLVRGMDGLAGVHNTVDGLLAQLLEEVSAGDNVLIMSNGGFGGLHQRFIDALSAAEAPA